MTQCALLILHNKYNLLGPSDALQMCGLMILILASQRYFDNCRQTDQISGCGRLICTIQNRPVLFRVPISILHNLIYGLYSNLIIRLAFSTTRQTVRVLLLKDLMENVIHYVVQRVKAFGFVTSKCVSLTVCFLLRNSFINNDFFKKKIDETNINKITSRYSDSV